MAPEWLNPLVDRVDEPLGPREEHGFRFRRRRDPVSGPGHHGGRVQAVETRLRQVRRDGPHYRPALDRVGNQQHFPSLSDRIR
jgi:hypothetical protein